MIDLLKYYLQFLFKYFNKHSWQTTAYSWSIRLFSDLFLYMWITTKFDRQNITFRWLFLYFQFIFFMTIISSMLFSPLPPVTSVASLALTFLLPFHQFLVQLTWIRDGFWFANGVISWHRSECFSYQVGFRVTFAHGYLEFTSH